MGRGTAEELSWWRGSLGRCFSGGWSHKSETDTRSISRSETVGILGSDGNDWYPGEEHWRHWSSSGISSEHLLVAMVMDSLTDEDKT